MIPRLRSLLLIATLTTASVGVAAQDETYATYREAAAAGAKAVRAGNLAAARKPLEAAAQLASTDREKIEAHRALLVPYRELAEIEPMQKAAEFVIANSKQAAERNLTCSALLSFIQKRGKIEVAIEGYEARLKTRAEDRTTLYLLTEAYATHKKDATRAAEVAEQLKAVEQKAKIARDIGDEVRLADLYVKVGKTKEGAELLEAIAASDTKMEAWYRKEAAVAWLKAGDKDKAVAAARKATAAKPEARSEQLAYFWRRGLGDVFLEAGKPKEAIPQYEEALKLTKVEGYLKTTREQLAKARAALVD